MKTPTDRFWAYLEPILKNISGVEFIQLSDGNRMDRLISSSVSLNTYPCIYVIRPKVRGFDTNSGTVWKKFQTIIYIFEKADLSDYEDQDRAYSLAERMGTELDTHLFKESKTYKCLYDMNEFEAEPIEYQTLDAAFGYEIKCSFCLPVNDLYYR